MGSMNFAFFDAARRIGNWKYDWERDYVVNSDDYIFRNTFRDIAYILETLKDAGTRFEPPEILKAMVLSRSAPRSRRRRDRLTVRSPLLHFRDVMIVVGGGITLSGATTSVL